VSSINHLGLIGITCTLATAICACSSDHGASNNGNASTVTGQTAGTAMGVQNAGGTNATNAVTIPTSTAAGSGSQPGGKSGSSTGEAGTVTTKNTTGGGGASGSAKTAKAGNGAEDTGSFPAVTNVGSTGPYTTKTDSASGPEGGYSIFYPEELAKGGVKNPIITWGSGGATNTPMYALLPHLASHGFVVIGSNAPAGVNDEKPVRGQVW